MKRCKAVNIIEGGITAPRGFIATGSHIGIKKIKKDISMLFSHEPCVVAGVFTQSVVRAAPIERNEMLLKKAGKFRGLLTISGNANACTGAKGTADNIEMARTYASCLGVSEDEILTAATGIIGLKMPMETINSGIKKTYMNMSGKPDDARIAAAGILTTDTFIKEVAVKINILGKEVYIGAMGKGSGMIHPNMATVLAFITTDIKISQELLQKALRRAVDTTYNMISVDGATSTNDMALVFANGLAGNEEIDETSEFYESFCDALLYVNEKIARDIVHDGEGSVKFIQAIVNGAKSEKDARLLAKSIVTNNLVKTAMFGEDANWGRVLAAMGGSGGQFDTAKVNMAFESEKGRIELMRRGEPLVFDENIAAEILSESDINIMISLFDGEFSATAWGCDLGHEYIRINGEYRSRT